MRSFVKTQFKGNREVLAAVSSFELLMLLTLKRFNTVPDGTRLPSHPKFYNLVQRKKKSMSWCYSFKHRFDF